MRGSTHVLCAASLGLLLHACGGGGGDDGLGGLPGVQRIALNNGNSEFAGNVLFVLSDNAYQMMAVLTAGAQVAHEEGLAPVSIACTFGGTVEIRVTDADGNGRLSAGDRVRVLYTNCNDVDGSLELQISQVSVDGDFVLSYEGSMSLDLDIDLGVPAELRGSATATFRITATEAIFVGTAVAMRASAEGDEEALTAGRIEKTIAAADFGFDVEISGTILSDSLGGAFTFATSPPLSGIEGNWPTAGQVTATGSGNSRVAFQATPGSPVLVSQLIDADGDGSFEVGATTYPWSNLLQGTLFGSPDQTAPPPADLNGRRVVLGAPGHDMAVDNARGRIYVTLPDRNELAIISAATLTVVQRVIVGPRPQGLEMSLDGSQLHVALNAAGAIAVVDLDTFAVSEIVVAQGLQHSSAFDVTEARPGVLFASANTGNFAHIARLDRNAGDAVTTVADDRIIRDRVELLSDPVRGFAYAGEGFSPNSLYKLDANDPAAPIILEDAHGTIDGTDRMSLSPDGTRIFLRSGQVLDTASLSVVGTVSAGIPWASANGADVVVGSPDGALHVHAAVSLALVDTLITDCNLTQFSRLAPSPVDQQWLLLGTDVLCGVDIANPGTPPGTGGAGVPPSQPPTVAVPVVDIGLGADGFDAEYDDTRNRVYVTLPSSGELLTIDAGSHQILSRTALGNRPRGIDLAPDGSHLAIMFNAIGGIGYLDLASNLLQSVDIGAALGAPNAHDVAYLGDDAVFATSDPSSGGFAHVVKTSRTNPAATQRVAGGSIIRDRPELAASADGAFLYVGEGFSPESLYKLDLGQADAPIVLEDMHGQVSGTDRLGVSPDGSRIALSTGAVLRTSDFFQAGQFAAGVPLYSQDGARAFVAGDAGRIQIFDASTYVAETVLQGGCSIGTPRRLIADADESVFVTLGLARLCFWMPAQPLTLAVAARAHSPYACGVGCLTRRLQPARSAMPAQGWRLPREDSSD